MPSKYFLLYFILHTCFCLVDSPMNKHKLSYAVTQCIIREFSTFENVKHIETWQRLNVHFIYHNLLWTQVCKRPTLFKMSVKNVKEGTLDRNIAQKENLLHWIKNWQSFHLYFLKFKGYFVRLLSSSIFSIFLFAQRTYNSSM